MSDSPTRPDLIQIQAEIEDVLEASYADLSVSVRGSNLVFGSAALEKAREVANLVKTLEAAGIPKEQIRLQDVTAEVTSGLLTKSSSATYTLEVRCHRLDGLGDVLGAIATQKNAQLHQIDWGYPVDEERRTAWLVQCARIADARARKLAEALNVKLIGVHRFAEPRARPPEEPPGAGSFGMGAPRARRVTADLGFAVSHTKKVTVRADVDYRVSPLG